MATSKEAIIVGTFFRENGYSRNMRVCEVSMLLHKVFMDNNFNNFTEWRKVMKTKVSSVAGATGGFIKTNHM